MTSWFADGGMSGFDAPTASLVDEKYLLASNGCVDVQGVTRLQYAFTSATDRIRATARINITAADVTAANGKPLSAAMYVAPASAFSPGVVPTPNQIRDLGSALQVYRASTTTTTAGNKTFTIAGPRAQYLEPNTKYWILVLPTKILNTAQAPSSSNDVQIDANLNTHSRGLSLWTNRTPTTPVITSPATGTVVASGSAVTFTFDPNDPDTYIGSNDYQYTDLAGIQVQYAPRPTAENPTPSWTDLPIANTSGTVLGKGWYIFGANDNIDGDGGYALWNTRTMQVRCGGSSLTAGYGALPAGEWQLRCRTFDWGHPYPGSQLPLAASTGFYTADSFPASNTSPWSATVNVTVAAQVPPPILISPINSIAVTEGSPVTLSWQYRNTAVPPFAQAHRLIQMREVGGYWLTIADEDSASSSYLVGDPTFEFHDDGTSLDGWSISDASTGPTLVGGGTGWVRVADFTGGSGTVRAGTLHRAVEAPIGLKTITISGRRTGEESWGGDINPSVDIDFFDSAVSTTIPVAASIIRSSGAFQNGDVSQTGGVEVVDAEWSATFEVTPVFDSIRMRLYSGTTDANLDIDDIYIVAGGISLQATTQYEWRVQVTDTDDVQSNFSEPGRFWVVPAPASGEVVGLPSETIDAATLGCGRHTIEVYRRGGKERVGTIRNVEALDWNRVRDDISTAKVVVRGWDIDCGNLLAQLQTWAYELVIFRDNGYTVDRVWEGPITLLTYEVDSVTIQAKDVMGYAYRRIIKQAMSDSATGDTVTSRAARVLQNTFAPDDPNVLAYLQVLIREDDAMEYRSTPAYSRTAFEEVDDMAANAGLDYTTVGRSIMLWGTKHRIGTLPEFRDVDLGSPPIVSEYGMSMANVYSVSDGNGVHGEAYRGGVDPVSGNIDEIYGLVEMLSSTWATDSPEDAGTYTQAGLATVIQSFEEYADRSISDRYPPPVVVRVPDNTTLNPGTVISIQHLVPGVVVPLRSTGTLRTVVANQKLDKVQVTERSDSEVISITLSPFSRDDTTTEEVAE